MRRSGLIFPEVVHVAEVSGGVVAIAAEEPHISG